MKQLRSQKAAWFVCLLVLLTLCGEVLVQAAEPAKPAKSVKPAESAKPTESTRPARPGRTARTGRPDRTGRGRGRWGVYGDWDVKTDYNEREYKSILSFSRDKEGKLTGNWISFWGMHELSDIKFEDDKLSFVQTYQNRNGKERTSKFAGTIKNGKISGIISRSDRDDNKLEGQRSKRTPRAVGTWALKLNDITSTLVVTADKEDKLSAEWKSKDGEHTITDIKYERGKLTFTRKSKIKKRQSESTFEGNIRGDTLTAAIKSKRGEVKAEGKRIGALVIGKWDLEIESERGNRKQRLQVNPDMSGLYGTIAIKKVDLEGDKVSFKTVLEFGERKYEMSFEGKIEEGKLAGELTTSRGTRKIKGTKVVRPSRRSRPR